MIDALAYEWVRLRTVRSTWWLSALAVVLSAGIATAASFGLRTVKDFDQDGTEIAHVLQRGEVVTTLTAGAPDFPTPFAALFMAVIGIFAFGHEYRHGTVRATLTALPRRDTVVLAKILVVAGWAAAIAAVTLVVNYLIARTVLGSRLSEAQLSSGTLARTSLAFIALIALWALIGLGLAGLFRNVPAAIVTILVVPLVAESILGALIINLDGLKGLRPIVPYFPFRAGRQMVATTTVSDAEAYLATPLAGGVTFAAAAAVVLAGAWLLFRTRDA